MALRDQPYIPLYVKDVLTDEKLIECSAESHGVYFRLICILHKQEQYGNLCLKQKYKQSESKYVNFASMLVRQMPFEQKTIENCLNELDLEGVISISDDLIQQKRMIKDGKISVERAKAGKKGGSNVTRQYGKSGDLYLMSDQDSKHKFGITTNIKARVYRIRSDFKLSKLFDVLDSISVENMGESEDFAKEFFKDIRDGEWLLGDFEDIQKKFVLLKAKLKARTQANSVNESVIENESNNNGVEIEKLESSPAEEIVEWLRECQGGMLDDTIHENIINCQDCLDKIKDSHPNEDAKSFLCKLIQAGLNEGFHQKNMGSFRYIFKNLTKLLILYNQPDL